MNEALMIALRALKEAKKKAAQAVDKTLTRSDTPADAKVTGDELKKKANGEGITLSINDSGGLRVTYNTEE